MEGEQVEEEKTEQERERWEDTGEEGREGERE